MKTSHLVQLWCIISWLLVALRAYFQATNSIVLRPLSMWKLCLGVNFGFPKPPRRLMSNVQYVHHPNLFYANLSILAEMQLQPRQRKLVCCWLMVTSTLQIDPIGGWLLLFSFNNGWRRCLSILWIEWCERQCQHVQLKSYFFLARK